MDAILNAMRREIARSRGGGHIRLGLVTSYDPGNFAVKVSLQPDNTETGWIAVGSPWVGNEWGMFFAPSIGDQVEVEFQEGGAETPIATMRLFDNQNRPLPVPSCEMWMVHKTGSFIKLTNDGKVAFHSATEIDAGNLGSGLLTLATSAIMAVYNGHTHPVSGDVTGTPNQQLEVSDFTTVLKAN